ncbi:MCP four helix bundle domain-containing protein [Rhodoferax ferrireducens]|uniref:MCP four helix bundle domain-containing protein n=1 Tax=Rhodoferax ferrireducens TaxID=192843 RepID=UPI001E417BDE|nr:MCP four helix bundle domain-containing protein [Rhodoferax ferrireducens]
MNKLKIGSRLALAFGLVLLITAIIAAIGVWRLGTLKAAAQQIASTELERNSLAQRWTADINLNWVRASSALKTSDAAYIDALQTDMAATSKSVGEAQKKLEALL